MAKSNIVARDGDKHVVKSDIGASVTEFIRARDR
jgi:hypothetical protein